MQVARPVMGESSLYIPVFFLEPDARLAGRSAPWEDVDSNLMSNNAATVILLLGEAGMLLGAVLTRPRMEKALGFAGLGVAGFIVLNRVFSPQYVLVLCVGYALGLIALSPPGRWAFFSGLVLLALTFLNYLVWPLWARFWFSMSALFFAVSFLLGVWLFYASIRGGAAQRTLPQAS
jgi:hypothetical protein